MPEKHVIDASRSRSHARDGSERRPRQGPTDQDARASVLRKNTERLLELRRAKQTEAGNRKRMNATAKAGGKRASLPRTVQSRP